MTGLCPSDWQEKETILSTQIFPPNNWKFQLFSIGPQTQMRLETLLSVPQRHLKSTQVQKCCSSLEGLHWTVCYPVSSVLGFDVHPCWGAATCCAIGTSRPLGLLAIKAFSTVFAKSSLCHYSVKTYPSIYGGHFQSCGSSFLPAFPFLSHAHMQSQAGSW